MCDDIDLYFDVDDDFAVDLDDDNLLPTDFDDLDDGELYESGIGY